MKPKYFSYCPNAGFETHATLEEAKKSADDSVDYFRNHSEDGWSEEVGQVCWGELKEQATMTDKEPCETGEFEYRCNYELKPIGEDK